MRALFDTNVVLDVLLGRAPHFADSAQCMALVSSGVVTGLLCATTVTTIHYLTERSIGSDSALTAVTSLLKLYEVAAVDGACLSQACAMPLGDYEDGVIHASALAAGADCVVTRDPSGFAGSSLPTYSPAQFAALIGSTP